MRRFQQTRHALGSTAYITLVLEDAVRPATLFDMLWQQIVTFEQRFSRFLQDSELSKFNMAAGTKQSISPPFRELLVSAKDMARKTNGLYNPFTLPALQRAGYKGSWPRPHHIPNNLNFETRHIRDWQQIEIGDTWAQIPSNTALDFGGIGKGFLLDQLAMTLLPQHIAGYWLSLGGDILCNGHDVTGDAWRIDIQDARQENKTAASVRNSGDILAIATSGTTKRQGISDNGPWHHLIDPRIGKPAETDILTATVCAHSGTAADIAAKCLVIAGSSNANTTLGDIGENNALLQTASKVIKLGDIWLR